MYDKTHNMRVYLD